MADINGKHSILENIKMTLLGNTPTTTVLIGLLLILLLTVLLLSSTATPPRTSQTPPSVPFLSYIPTLLLTPSNFLPTLRKKFYTQGLFTLRFLNTRHNILFQPGLATALLNQKVTHASNDATSKRLMRLNFGFPGREMEKYDAAYEELMAAYRYISTEPYLGEMVTQTARAIRENVQNLVTGARSLVDLMVWEKGANVKVKQGVAGGAKEEVVEVSLYPLLRDFCAWTANPCIIGTDFMENNPDFMSDMWTLDRGFLLLATGLPRWTPWPALTRAHIARKRNLDRLDEFHRMMQKHWEGLDAGPKWSSLDDVGKMVKARMEIYNKHNFSIRARASIEHALLWAGNANSCALVFWMICRIYGDKSLLALIRQEIAPFVELTQEETGLPIPEPPQFTTFDVEGLTTKCPLLKSCYVECLRVDAGSWSFKTVQQDFVLQGREKDAQPWLLRKGDYAHVAHDLHNTDPKYFDDPLVWKADRHVKYDEKGQRSADMGSIRPYGGGHTMCKGRQFALKEVMMFSAAILAMWEIEMAGGGPWKMPSPRTATGVYATNDDTRVWIRRRKLPTVE